MQIGLAVAATSAAIWIERCAQVPAQIQAMGLEVLDRADGPDLWLIVPERTQPPLGLRFQLSHLTRPAILITERAEESRALASHLRVPLLVVHPSITPEALADLCVLATTLSSGSVAALSLWPEGEMYA